MRQFAGRWFSAISWLGLGVVLVTACDRSETAKPVQSAEQVSAPARAHPAAAAESEPPRPAMVGQAAPDFALQDLDGKTRRLSDYHGKTVVLEWFNPECPFVRLSHTKGSLKGLADKYADDHSVVWLAVNSGGEGRQGYGVEKNREGVNTYGIKHPVLLDPRGQVGHAYGATNTPHMFIIDPNGTLAYAGAIDNSPDAEGQSASGRTLINYVAQALDELARGKPVSVPTTKAYGCSVKYAKN